MSDLLSRYLSQAAKRCPKCGSEYFLLTPAGALCCFWCNPDAEAASVAMFVAKPNPTGLKLHWELWSDDFDGPLPIPASGGTQEPLAAETRGVLGGGEAGAGGNPFAGLGAGGAGERVDPVSPPGVGVIVGTNLAWFITDGEFWLRGAGSGGNGDIEIVGAIHGWPPAGVYRRLNQAYFSWLCQQVEAARSAGKLRGQELDDAQGLLATIAFAAFGLGVFGGWAVDPSRFPIRAPAGYAGPQCRGCVRLIAWTEGFDAAWDRVKQEKKSPSPKLSIPKRKSRVADGRSL